MSLASALPSYTSPAVPRKRTTSFCCSSPRPTKSPRTGMGSLRRTESFLCLRDMQKKSSASTSTTTTTTNRSSRERPKPVDYTAYVIAAKSPSPISSPTSSPVTTPTLQRAVQSTSRQYSMNCTYRSSSPLSPNRTPLPGRPIFPKSRTEPDLYKKAIIARMRCSPEGQRILHMGPKLAFSIMAATKELERIVAAQDTDNDVAMSETSPTLSHSWVVVSPEAQDWEMVDCGA
ncbi:hypothetical protein J3R30DRAFT_2588927 [Lentinula aciculospora]|uniref:Uncharacterized protein n=1 Tax=Lentinula aciculospora TaxID=153920 RepID=A0A9W9AEJ7_9AGAR|nr:hypothetical protein J3R30DRAFT_2588927 [Lentinula aciculospora]